MLEFIDCVKDVVYFLVLPRSTVLASLCSSTLSTTLFISCTTLAGSQVFAACLQMEKSRGDSYRVTQEPNLHMRKGGEHIL